MRLILSAISCLLLTVSAVALTPKERTIVLRARNDLVDAMKSRDAARQEVDQARMAVLAAESSASGADKLALDAEKRAAESDKRAAADHKVVIEVNRWGGAGAIVYGIKRLLWHFLILFAVLAIATILLEIFVPWIRPILKIVFSVPGRLIALLWRKNNA